MGEFSLTHWLVIAVIGIVFFGPKRLPALGASLGESIRGFKKALNDHHESVPPVDQQNSTARRDAIQTNIQADVRPPDHQTSGFVVSDVRSPESAASPITETRAKDTTHI